MNSVVVQKWEESERGWGQRPDGYSLHLSEEDRKEFIRAYWELMPDAVPDEYERPCGSPYEAEIDAALHEQIEIARTEGVCGIRFFDNKYPGSGGTDGWVPHRPMEGERSL